MDNIRLKLNAAAVQFLRMAIEGYLMIPAGSYTAVLEHGALAGLLKRKAVMFMYPKEMCTLALRPAEAAAVHRLVSRVYGDNCDVRVRSLAYVFMAAIGPKMLFS